MSWMRGNPRASCVKLGEEGYRVHHVFMTTYFGVQGSWRRGIHVVFMLVVGEELDLGEILIDINVEAVLDMYKYNIIMTC